jgi:hypothetical protein
MADKQAQPRRRAWSRERGLWLVLAAVCFGACSDDVESQARLLDEACEGVPCQTTGSARQTTGITEDSVGFKLGPSPGTVTIPLPDFSEAGDDSFDVEVLVAGRGSYTGSLRQPCSSAGCNPVVDSTTASIPREYEWRSVGVFLGNKSTFQNFEVELEVAEGSELDLADVRYDTFDHVNCSVAVVGR